MVVLHGAIMSLPLARWFYEIEPIPLEDAVELGLVALVWALVVLVLRRAAFVDRLVAATSSLVAVARHDL